MVECRKLSAAACRPYPESRETAQMAGVQEQEVFGQIADARSRLFNATQAAPAGS